MATPQEPDFPPGHPARCDYDPTSPEAQAWMRQHYAPKGARDFPVGHPKAMDTPGNSNAVQIVPGVDPAHPELQPFTGYTPAQVKARKQVSDMLSQTAQESPVVQPVIAPTPPPPGDTQPPSGQPVAAGTTPGAQPQGGWWSQGPQPTTSAAPQATPPTSGPNNPTGQPGS